MTVQEEIIELEKRLQTYKNNHEFAVKNNNKIRQTKYANFIREVKEQIKQLERDIPIESNKRLRKIIDDLHEEIDGVREDNKKLITKIEAEAKRIDAILNPPKVIPPEETDLKTNVLHECPACGRGGFKGSRGVKAHQASGACKAAH